MRVQTYNLLSQEHANKSLVLDTWKIVIMHCKKIRRFYGKIPGIWAASSFTVIGRLPVEHFLEIKIW